MKLFEIFCGSEKNRFFLVNYLENNLLRAGVLGDGLCTFTDSMLGKFTRQ